MPTIAQQLARSRRLVPEVFPAAGEDTPDQKVADLAVAGLLPFTFRDSPVLTGRRNVDWSGGLVKHQEWPAQLNRFGYLNALRAAYVRSGNESHARAARDYIEDWLDAHPPYGPGPTDHAPGDSTLNMAIRLGGLRFIGWLGNLPDLAASAAFDEPLAERIVQSVAWQLDWLAANLPARGNWRVAALDCLLGQALRLPDRFGRHLDQAVRDLNTEFAHQILPDGVHEERSGGYHDWMSDVYVKLWRLGRRMPALNLRLDDRRIVAMHAYTLHHTKPNGALCGFNDARARLRTGDDDAGRLPALLAEHQALRGEAGESADVPPAGVFTAAGHVFYRTGFSAEDTWWAFDAGDFSGGHAHLSRLALELHAGRRTVLPDPGIFDYEMSNPMAAVGKGTPAHSTMNVGLRNQADVGATLLRAADLPAAVIAQGRYQGSYWSGAFGWRFVGGRGQAHFGAHDRTVVWIKDRCMIVLDCLRHEAHAEALLHWLSDDVPVTLDADRLAAVTGDPEGNVALRVCPLSDSAAAASVRRGQTDPPLGWVAGGDFSVRPAPLIQFAFRTPNSERNSTAITECATVIVPFTGRTAPPFSVAARAVEPFVRSVEVRWPAGRCDRLIFTRELTHPIRQLDDLRTDARLLLLSTAPGQPDRLTALDAQFLTIAGRDVAV